jgi:zinc protease
MSQIAFGENSDLYQKLVLKEQKVDMIDGGLDTHIYPEMFAVMARVKNVKDMDYVRDQILATYKRYSEELIPQEKLDATRSRMRYSLAMRMNSAEAIAGTLAPYVGLRRTPETLNTLFELADTITPEDIRNVCKKYFVENNRTIVTLATKQGNSAKEGGR